MNATPTLGRNGYPLSMLFVLLTACATLVAVVRLAVRSVSDSRWGAEEIVAMCVGASILCCVTGVIVGLFQQRRRRGMLDGGLLGLLIGACCGPVVFIPAQQFPAVVLTATMGAVLLIAVSATASRAMKDRSESAGVDDSTESSPEQ